jgi:xanthine dehydrogenase YagR molybdenum-binding subunit
MRTFAMLIDSIDKKPAEQGEEQGEKGEQKLEIAEREAGHAWPADARLAIVGRRHPRVEGPDKVTGRARYSYDVHLPGQLYARVLRSPHPHARITRIDASAAEALPGVRAVLSSANIADVPWYKTSRLFDTTVRFVGDEVAAVAADSIDIAEDALRLIEIEYEVLPFVVDIERALAPGAPLVHAEGNLVDEPEAYARGDVERGFAEADVLIEQTYRTQTALHNSLEPHGCTASWEGENLTLWSSTQSIFTVRQDVAESLGLPEQRVRVIKQHMGGGFGAKQIAWKHDAVAALLSRASGRPVQLMLDREAENLAAGNRNSTVQHVKIGARRDGTLTAIQAEIDLATGAYLVGGEASKVDGIYQSLYRCPNVRTVQRSVYLNLGPAVAFRAPGFVEGAFGLESAIDELARALSLDPIELRQKNYTGDDQKKQQPYTLPDGLRLCYERASQAFDWKGSRASPSSPARKRGVGVAAHSWVGGGGNPPGYAWVKLNSDGTADVVTGTQDIGTGTRTALVQIAAEELGIAPACVAVHLGDTASGPYSPASAGSSTLPTIGPAVRAAAFDARQQLLAAAARLLDVQPDQLEVGNGTIYASHNASKRVSVEELMGQVAPHMILGQGARGPKSEELTAHTFGVQIVEVEVDTETGEVTVLQVVATHDCGRIVNPATVESQVIGGVTQGIGYALTEERILDGRSGIVLNANLEEYKVPTVADVPPIVHAPVDVADTRANSLGAKGVGEPPVIPTAPAIANAIFDAVGVRLRAAPLSRRRVVEALAHKPQQ